MNDKFINLILASHYFSFLMIYIKILRNIIIIIINRMIY